MHANRMMELRERLVKNLKHLIGNPVIEAKELAAFDLIMDRRQFLKAAQLSAIGALVASACPPTAWGRYDRKLHVHPRDVGLSDGDMSAVSQATQLTTGTELFQDTIYAQPVVAAEAVNSHALIEGARGRSRIQSDLLSVNPDEYQFLDHDYHFGPPELIQLEQDGNGDWELVHYRHPWGARTDGARTDGLEREIIMTKADGLADPVKVIAITGTYTNRFYPQQADQASSLSYMVYVEEANSTGHILVGQGLASVPPPYNELPVYPIRWVSGSLTKLDWGLDPGALLFADKYTSSAWQSPGDNTGAAYTPERQAEHLLLYYDNYIWIITLLDTGDTDPGIMATIVPYPFDEAIGKYVSDPRIVHIDWDPTHGRTGTWPNITNIVWGASSKASNGDVTYSLFMQNTSSRVIADQGIFAAPVRYTIIPIGSQYQVRKKTIPAADLQNGDLELDYASLRSVHGLHTTINDGNWYHVKMANFEGRGVCLFTIIKEGPPDEIGSIPPFFFGGHFPLAFPEAAGLGTINALSGGTSKFGGFRFVASDADGNVFLMRQRRDTGIDSPYAPPIYGQNTSTGTPKTTWSNDEQPPAGTSSTSNLNDLQAWIDASAPSLGSVKSFLLNAALAFATDDTSESQAVWLGNTFQAAYASKRFALDSEHVVIQKVQNGGTDTYAAFTMFKNPVDKTWHQRQIATQILPQGPGLQETGDHYQATVTPANAYGKTVSLLLDENANLLIEVRADSPCTVIDDTNNLYYDIDRYTSFMAAPDPATGRLCLLVKAETFSQVLYVRLVDTSGLQPSNDAAMLTATGETTYAWQSVNLALQAQQRMGNGATPSDLLGDAMPLADTTVYVSGDTLEQSNPDTPWKGGYSPSTDNLGSLATYLNTSGQNLIATSDQLSLGASADGVTIDPLYAVTTVPADSSRTALTTQFAYNTGKVITTPSALPPLTGGEFGSIWSSISHALHDALHWLQHVEGTVYKDLASGVTIVSAVESITVTVGKDIMKQVNGVEQELNEVVNTVEEYASVVANLVVTVVESTYLYKFIETIITLISLFLHFKDVLSLSNSLKGLFDDILSGSNGESIPSIDSAFSSWDAVKAYLGPNNTIAQTFGGVDSRNVASELIQGLLDAILNNPLSKKILNKIMSALSSLLNEVLPTPPLSFDMDQSAAQGIMDDITGLVDNLEQGVADMAEQTAVTLIEVLAASAADPQQTYRNLGSQLGLLSEELATDFLPPVFDFIDEVTTDAPTYAKAMIDYSPYITLNITVLADLCKLFGIGGVSNSKLTLKASEAVFFPLALIAWVAVYTHDGRSISSVDELDDDFLTASGEVGASGATLWNLVRLAVDGALTELGGIVWLLTALAKKNGQSPTAVKTIAHAGAWLNWTRWMNDYVYTCRNWNPATGHPLDFANVAIRLTTASADLVFTLPDLNLNPGTGWPSSPRPTDMSQVVNLLATLGIMVYDTYLVAESHPNANQILSIAGQDFARSQIFATFLYNIFPLEEYLTYFAVYVLTCPAGFELQAYALTEPFGSTGGRGRPPWWGHGRRRHPRRPRGKGPQRRHRGYGRSK